MLVYAALLVPFHNITIPYKQKRISLPGTMMKDIFKAAKGDREAACNVLVTASTFKDIVAKIVEQNGDAAAPTRVEFGLVVKAAKSHWQAALLLGTGWALLDSGMRSETDIFQKTFTTVYEQVWSYGLDGVWTVRPLLNGRDLQQKLNIRGPVVGQAMKRLGLFQLEYPSATPEEAVEFLRASSLDG